MRYSTHEPELEKNKKHLNSNNHKVFSQRVIFYGDIRILSVVEKAVSETGNNSSEHLEVESS